MSASRLAARRSTKLRTSAAALLALGALAGCGPRLDQVWELKEFRVLGARAEPPEPNRGEAFSLRLVHADPRSRPVSVAWIVSPIPLQPAPTRGVVDAGTPLRVEVCAAVGSGGFPLCPMGFQCGCGETARFTVPPTGGMLGSTGRETLSVLGYACAGGRLFVSTDLTNPFSCDGDGARGWTFVRTVPVRQPASPSPRNENPAIAEVRFGPVEDRELAVLTTDSPRRVARCEDAARVTTMAAPTRCPRFAFELRFADGSRQRYVDRDPIAMTNVDRQERITVGFVTSGGEFAGGFRTDSEVEPESAMRNEWFAPATAQRVRVLFYATDSRGGFDFTERALVVE